MTRDLYSRIESAAQAHGLAIYGAFHPRQGLLQQGTLVLFGTDRAFWPEFTQTPEWQDGQSDPVDRWSERVISGLAERFAARAYYPFGGPPHMPFVDWGLASGRAFTSPSQFLVHDQVGLMISYRGALHLEDEIPVPAPPLGRSPCSICSTSACLNTCPEHALVDGGPYKVAACHNHLETRDGTQCLEQGCLARLACPVSQRAGRDPAQSAHHMRYFHPS